VIVWAWNSEDVRAMLKEKGSIKPITAQLKDATGIMPSNSLYKMDRSNYGKPIEEMENDVLQRKDPFPKMVADACRVLAGWKIRYSNKYTRTPNANDSMALLTMGNAEKKNAGHYSNECDGV